MLLKILATSSFMPHGYCYLWKSSLVWLHLVSDCSIAIAYYSISITPIYFVRKRQDLLYSSIFILFAAFIVSCGNTHAMEIWTLWHSNYWLSGLVKALTALISCYTAIELIPLMPKVLALPSTGQLKTINLELEQEIAERLKTETALRESEQRYRAIVEDQTELIARFQPDGTLTFINQAYCRYFGKEQKDLVSNDNNFKPFIFPEDLPKIEVFLQTLTLESPVKTIEHRVIVNGEVRWMQWINRMIFDDRSKFIELQSVGRDITERKQAEKALQQRESILRSFYNSASMMMGIIQIVGDDDLLSISDNIATAEFLGLSPEAIKGRLGSEIGVPVEIRQKWNENCRQSQLTGDPIRFEYFHPINKDKIYLSVTVSLIANTVNEQPWFSYIAEDITERKRAKELQEQETLLKEIHHRVKNNLQVICSLLNLQSRSLKDRLVIEKFKETQNRVRSMSLVHEQLYQSKNIARIDLAEYIRNLANSLLRSYTVETGKVTLKTEIKQNFLLDLETKVLLLLTYK
jgi:PAS domain S-box-containing protein